MFINVVYTISVFNEDLLSFIKYHHIVDHLFRQIDLKLGFSMDSLQVNAPFK